PTYLTLSFFFNAPATPDIYTLSLHDALPIYIGRLDPKDGSIKQYPMPDPMVRDPHTMVFDKNGDIWFTAQGGNAVGKQISPFLSDRKSTRLNSSHVAISYAVFCLKKKK